MYKLGKKHYSGCRLERSFVHSFSKICTQIKGYCQEISILPHPPKGISVFIKATWLNQGVSNNHHLRGGYILEFYLLYSIVYYNLLCLQQSKFFFS